MKKNSFALILYAIFWLSLFGFTKVWISGFHWIDDHEVYSINEAILHNGYISTLGGYIKHDLDSRFRPLFYFIKVTQVYLFKDHAFYYYLYDVVMAIFTSFFLYLFAVKIRFNQVIAFMFPFFVLLGSQSDIWFLLGAYENHGIFFFSISLWMCSLAVFNKPAGLYGTLSILFMLFASFCKESFIVLTPAVVCIYIWLLHEHRHLSFKKIIADKPPFIIALLLVIIAQVVGVFTLVHTGVGYAGINHFSMGNIGKMLDSLNAIFFDTNRNIRLEGNNYGFFIIVFMWAWWYIYRGKFENKKEGFKSFINELLPVLVITIVIIALQIVLYMHLGMERKYLIPSTLGVSLLTLYLADRILKVEKNTVARFLLFCFLSWTLIKSATFCYKLYKEFAKIGMDFNSYLALIKQHSQPSDPILIVSDLYEYSELSFFSIQYFNSSLNNRKNVYLLYATEQKMNDLNESSSLIGKGARELIEEKSYTNHSSLDYKVIAMKAEEEHLLYIYNVANLKNYKRQTIDNEWVVYYK